MHGNSYTEDTPKELLHDLKCCRTGSLNLQRIMSNLNTNTSGSNRNSDGTDMTISNVECKRGEQEGEEETQDRIS